jgi:hypothetical protein
MILVLVLFIVAALSVSSGVASAHTPESHHMTVQAGPYPMEVGFSDWPLVAERSFDVTFTPEDGIAGKTATIQVMGPSGPERRVSGTLGRHPRQRDIWGLDLISLPDEGEWTFVVGIDGPLGPGEATIGPIPVGPRPGPAPLPMWLIAALPLFAIAGGIMTAWRRVRPGRTPEASAWE